MHQSTCIQWSTLVGNELDLILKIRLGWGMGGNSLQLKMEKKLYEWNHENDKGLPISRVTKAANY